MIALGIDPGTRRVGYGVIELKDNKTHLLTAGILSIKSTSDAPALLETKKGLDRLIARYHPSVMGIEKLFFSKNQKTAIAVAQARGVLLLAAEERGIRIKEFTPNEVKLGVTGYGLADKKAVLKMVRLILGEPALAVIDDASDALALAILSTGK